MNIAVEMATKMLLHKEETYTLVPDAPKELVIRSESMRRTLVRDPLLLPYYISLRYSC